MGRFVRVLCQVAGVLLSLLGLAAGIRAGLLGLFLGVGAFGSGWALANLSRARLVAQLTAMALLALVVLSLFGKIGVYFLVVLVAGFLIGVGRRVEEHQRPRV